MMNKLVILSLLFAYNASAKESTMQKVKKYAIPCAVSLVVGAIADETGAGLVGCAAATSTVYVLEDRRKKAQLDERTKALIESQVQKSVKAETVRLRDGFKAAISEALDKALQKNSQYLTNELEMKNEETKEIMREVMASELVEMKSELQAKFLGSLQDGSFMSKMNKRMEQSAKSYYNKNKEEIIREATERTIKQVIKQEIGITNPGL